MERFGSSIVLLDKLAAGGMAEVYRAKQLGHGGFEKIVAVKRILPQYAESEDFKDMFLQEASLSALLMHPNVIQTYSNGEVEGYLYLTMEFIDGKNLRQILAKVDRIKKRVPMEHALYMIAEAAKGLHYAHTFIDERSGRSMNIVHRDMSPQNIMLGYDGTVKIVDFGIAKMAAQAESTRAGVLKGKFGYMSPEQARGMPIDHRTDVFALGIILFELLTQRRLFASDDDMKTLRLVRDCKIPKPSKYNPSISPQLDQIVLKALTKEKSDRFSTALEMYEDLQRHLQELYPKYITGDFSKFLKTVFSDEISEEKQKREKLHRDAPAVLAESQYQKDVRSERDDQADAKKDVQNATIVDDDLPTKVSNTMNPVEDLQLPELGDPSLSSEAMEGVDFVKSPSTSTRINQLSLDAHGQDLGDRGFGDSDKTAIRPVEASHLAIELPRARVAQPSKPSNKNPARDTGKTRRLAYVSLILIGVVFYLSQSEQPTTVVADLTDGAPTTIISEPAPDPSLVVPEPSDMASLEEPNRGSEGLPRDLAKDSSAESPDVKVEPSRKDMEFTGAAPIKDQPPTTGIPNTNHHLSGYLKITSYPRADKIIINGQVQRSPASGEALSSPVAQLALAPGQYEVILQNTTFGVSWQGTVIIRSQRISPLEDIVLK